MPIWEVHPKTVKAATEGNALRQARNQLKVVKVANPTPIPDPPPTPPPPTTPPFLSGLTKQWSDDCSSAKPVESGRWCEYTMERKDGNEASSTAIDDIASGRFIQYPNGGPFDRPYYHFNAPASDDNIWSAGSVGRSEIGYMKGSPGGTVPNHPGPNGAFFFYEGRHHVILFSIRLTTGWDVNRTGWRVVNQWKQNEWVDTGGKSPALALEQKRGKWVLCNFGGNGVMDLIPATAGQWVNFAFDVHFTSTNSGTVKVWADTNLDGTYDYQSATWTGQTLCPRPGGGPGVESAWINGVYEEQGGDQKDQTDHQVWG